MTEQFRIDSLGEHPTLFTASDEGIVFEEGDVVAGRFEVISAIGGGGMGLVYKVKDTLMEGEVKALKVILPSLVRSEKAQQRFALEARIAQKLSHENIVNTYDLGEYSSIRFITMEFLEGESFADLLNREKSLPLDKAVRIVREAVVGLAYAHRSTVHRDIKPQNIFLCTDGTVKILDFGLARIIGSQRFAQSSTAVGTATYMAPEQFKGEEPTAQSDLYSIGVVLYQCLVGEMPLGRFKMPGEIGLGYPAALDELLDSLLDPAPDKRPADCQEVLSRLDAIRKMASVESNRPAPPVLSENQDKTGTPIRGASSALKAVSRMAFFLFLMVVETLAALMVWWIIISIAATFLGRMGIDGVWSGVLWLSSLAVGLGFLGFRLSAARKRGRSSNIGD